MEDAAFNLLTERVGACEQNIKMIYSNKGEIEGLLQRMSVIEALAAGLKNDHLENEVQLRIVTDGYQTILREVRETRSSVETLFQKQAEANLNAVQRHSVLLKWTMRGVTAITMGVAAMGAIHALLTGSTWSSSVIDIIKMAFGD